MEVARPPASAIRPEPQQLDFYESMDHFRTMFPTMDEEVIEAVLRANSGAVDATVDQLLNMSSDCTDTSALSTDFTDTSELEGYEDSVAFDEEDESSSDEELEGAVASPDAFMINIIPPSPQKATSNKSPLDKQANRSPQPMSGQSPNSNQSTRARSNSHTDSPHPFANQKRESVMMSQVDGQCVSSANQYDVSQFQETNEIGGKFSAANQIEEHVYHAPPQPRPVHHAHHHHHGYMNSEVNHMPGIPEDEAPSIPEKPSSFRREPNWLDASITDLVNMGHQTTMNGSGTNPSPSNFGRQMDTLTIDEDDNIFITPTNLTIEEVIPDAPNRNVRFPASNVPKERRPRSMSMPTFEHKHLSPVSLYKKYRPAMLGELPEDFLRLNIGGSSRKTSDVPEGQVSRPRGNKGNAHPRYHKRSSSEQSHVVRQQGLLLAPGMTSSRHGHHVRTHSSRMQREGAEVQQAGDWLAGRLAENERMRCEMAGTGDSAAWQVLQDEYLALMLQNDEFLRELRQDDEFMTTLQRERRPAKRPAAAMTSEPAVMPVDAVLEADLESGVPKPNEMQGYGKDDSHMTTFLEREAPVFEKPLDQHEISRDEIDTSRDIDKVSRDSKRDSGDDSKETREFRQQLSHMGATSKRKFMALARRFFSRKTPSKPLYVQGTTPSTMCLLMEEELPVHDQQAGSDVIQKDDIAQIPSTAHLPEHDVITSGTDATHHEDVTAGKDIVC